MKKTIFLLVFCLALTSVYAQQKFSISGRVIDADDKDYIVGASVYNQDNGTGTVTDIDGRYYLSDAEVGDQLRITDVRYIDKYHDIKHSGAQPDIKLVRAGGGLVLQSKIPFSSYDKYAEEQPKQ